MRHFTELNAWKNGMELVKEIQRIAILLPSFERFGISQQLRKASTSILANMAEGFSRFTFADKANKYVIARGECSEVEAFLFMIVALKYVQDSEIHRALEYVEVERKLISGMISSCRKRQI